MISRTIDFSLTCMYATVTYLVSMFKCRIVQRMLSLDKLQSCISNLKRLAHDPKPLISSLGEINVATLTIIDDDIPGVIYFVEDDFYATSGDEKVIVRGQFKKEY